MVMLPGRPVARAHENLFKPRAALKGQQIFVDKSVLFQSRTISIATL